MQLFALQKNGLFIEADKADKNVSYYCLECGGLMHLRAGDKRQLHFYHIQSSPSCALHKKSQEHLQTQRYIQSLYGKEQALLEVQRSEIERIADVLVEKEKLVFEIQCSYMSDEELRKRNEDWAALGYYVVWILHDHRYGKRKKSSIERSLLSRPHYFTNIDKDQRGIIYDKYQDQSLKFSVDVSVVYRERSVSSKLRIDWPLHFKGDMIDREPRSLFFSKNIGGNYLESLKQRYEKTLNYFLKRVL